MLQSAVVGQQQQTLAVGVQSACRIDAGNADKLGQRTLTRLASKLTEHLKWFVEEQVTVGQRIRAFSPKQKPSARLSNSCHVVIGQPRRKACARGFN
jgi:hypothetical protein